MVLTVSFDSFDSNEFAYLFSKNKSDKKKLSIKFRKNLFVKDLKKFNINYNLIKKYSRCFKVNFKTKKKKKRLKQNKQNFLNISINNYIVIILIKYECTLQNQY